MKPGKDLFDYPIGKTPKYYPLSCAVLFFDVVGFTKNTTNEEMERIILQIEDVLKKLLYDEYNWHEKKRNDLILIPTGDGYAIGFHPNKFKLEQILDLTSKIFKRLVRDSAIKVRMGIAKGPNIRHEDLNEHNNLFGFGINTANRVMSLAIENQILIHEDFAAEVLRSKSMPELVDIGEYTIKHNQKIKVFNYYIENDFGNPTPPER